MQLNGYVNTNKTTKVHHERIERKKNNDLYYHLFLIFSWKLYTKRHIHKTFILHFIGIHILICVWSTGACHFKFTLSVIHI